MRTISVRLDDSSEAKLDHLCRALGLSQSDVVKAGLAEQLDLVGCFASAAEGHTTRLGQDHSEHLRRKLQRQHREQRSPSS